MTNRTLALGRIHLRATDGLIVATLAFFSLVAVLFFRQVEGWRLLVLKNIAVGAGYLLFIHASHRAKGKSLTFLLRVTAVTLAYAYLFGAVDKLQLILHGRWLDSYVMDAESRVFGGQPTLWLQRITHPVLTEWLMFAYVIYIPMYPVLCGIIYYVRGELAMEDYFFTLGFTNILCDLGFILFPVAGPIPTMGSLYTVPLDGYFWTYLGEVIRSRLHFVGGSIPSPHAAAATIMWMMAFRYHRKSFYLLSPVILSLYVATFYARYHFVTDAVVGVGVAFLALATAPALMRAWDRIADARSRQMSKVERESRPEPVQEAPDLS